ncbi:MAG: hypothetical protein HZB15_17865 [Actinobacteria bacterium]|nr:hypothetical protein [Actinomycetota bacterium]
MFGVAPRVLAAVGSGVSALVIIAGALYSAWRLIRRSEALVARSSVLSAKAVDTRVAAAASATFIAGDSTRAEVAHEAGGGLSRA